MAIGRHAIETPSSVRPKAGRATPIPARLEAERVTIAEERIDRLHDLAREAARADDDDLARRYVGRARRIAERNRLSLPRSFKRFTCDDCDAYLIPGRNARVRTRDGHVTIRCDCGATKRYPYR